MPTRRNRAQLRSTFQSGAKPSAANFADFIESNINSIEDGISPQAGADEPLKIEAVGGSCEVVVD